MRVFVTGGTGYVGSAVLEALVRAGHHVDVHVRNNEGVASVQARGGRPILGDILQRASWCDAAAAADGAIHAAVDYGPQQVAPGDFIPGAGRVLRIERRGDDWFVLTSQGIIASDPTQY